MWIPLALFLFGLCIMIYIEINETKPKILFPEVTMLQPHRPFTIKAINCVGKAAKALGFSFPSLRPKDIVAAALKRAGLKKEPGGADKQSYMPGLEFLCGSLALEANLTQIGRLVAHGTLKMSLANRFVIDYLHETNKEIRRQKVSAPLVIMGMARTGTTFLHGLLSQDRSLFRSPLHHETMYPAPLIGGAGDGDESLEGRRDKIARDLQQFEKLCPNFGAFHKITATTPEECVTIFQQDVMAQSLYITLNCPSYDRWMQDQDMSSTMRHHRRLLQYLQHREEKEEEEKKEKEAGGDNSSSSSSSTVVEAKEEEGGSAKEQRKDETKGNDPQRSRQWLLKTPQYLIMLGELIMEYPDAEIIWTHRPPKDVLASLSAISTKLMGVVTDEIDPKNICKNVFVNTTSAIAKAMATRKALERMGLGKRFCDVQFDRLCAQPMATVRRIYKHFGKKLEPDAEARMQLYLKEHPRFKHGKPQYNIKDTFETNPDDLKLPPLDDYEALYIKK